MTTESIVVLGRRIKYEIKDVDIYSLEYYNDNPRINYIISRTPAEKVTQNYIEQELLKLDSTKERMKDLEDNKGLIDEVYVLEGKVVEGNTRLCAYRRLHKKYPDDGKWETIKARVLQGPVSEEELFYILGTFHIKGKTPWDAYEKAAYIYKMIKVLKKNPEEIGKQLGIQNKTIEAKIKAYEAMSNKYLAGSSGGESLNGGRDDLKKYSYFEAFYTQKDLVQKANETPAFLDEFVDWVKEDRFKNAQSVRELPDILSHKKSCRTFCETDAEDAFEEAKHVLYEHKPEKVDRFYKKIREFRDLLREAKIVQIKSEIDENPNKKTELSKCYKELKRFCKDIGLDI